MRLKDWEILQVGDRVTRVKHESAAHVAQRTNTTLQTRPNAAVATERVDFQVVQVQNGRVTGVRLLSREASPGLRTTVTEVVELEMQAATDEVPVDCEGGTIRYTWEWNAPARGEARLTGGFTVTRADGSVETERCPTETTR